MIKLNICLTDLPKHKIMVGKNGKKYINLLCGERKTEGNHGETHWITVSKTREEIEEKTDDIFVGSGKAIVPKAKSESSQKMDEDFSNDDLPF